MGDRRGPHRHHPSTDTGPASPYAWNRAQRDLRLHARPTPPLAPLCPPGVRLCRRPNRRRLRPTIRNDWTYALVGRPRAVSRRGTCLRPRFIRLVHAAASGCLGRLRSRGPRLAPCPRSAAAGRPSLLRPGPAGGRCKSTRWERKPRRCRHAAHHGEGPAAAGQASRANACPTAWTFEGLKARFRRRGRPPRWRLRPGETGTTSRPLLQRRKEQPRPQAKRFGV